MHSMSGHIQAAKVLLDCGALVDKTDHNHCTALMNAAILGYDSFVERLLARGANPNAQNVVGETALMRAANAGFTSGKYDAIARKLYPNYVHTVHMLLVRGAKPNTTDTSGATALMRAAQHGLVGDSERPSQVQRRCQYTQ